MSRLLLMLFLFISIGNFAQNTELIEPELIKRIVEGTQINTLLKIDWILNDHEWQYAKSVTDFVQIVPLQGEKANHKTVLSVLYNSRFLYFGIFAQDSLGKRSIRATKF